MSLAKTANENEIAFFNIDEGGLVSDDAIFVSDDGAIDETDLDGSIVALDIDGDNEPDFSFILPTLPGSDIEVVEDEDGEISVLEDDDQDVEVQESDMWDWQSSGMSNFLPWLMDMTSNKIPKHSGYDTVGIERAIAFLDNLDKIISKAVRTDLKDELDVAKIEKIRDEINDGLERLEKRLDQVSKKKYKRKNKKSKKKEASLNEGELVKNAQKIAGIDGIVVTVPLLISRIARVIINGVVSGGHDIEDMFERQSKKYKLTDREEAETMQLLEDMGWAIRRDRGFLANESIDPTSEDNFDWSAQYYA